MAGRIPQSFIDELINRVDIVEIIDSRVPLKKAGREYTACCPFHNEKTPSFTVSPDKQFYHCFGCGAHGTAVGFLMELEHMEFPEAIEELARHLGLEVPREGATGGTDRPRASSEPLYALLDEADRFYRRQLREHPQAQRAIDYLKQRGLSGEIAADFGIGFAPPGWDTLLTALSGQPRERLIQAGLVIAKDSGGAYDRFRERVMFPIRDRRGRTIAFGGRVLGDDTPKYLNSPESPLFHKGKELYGLYEARKAVRDLRRLLIVEGYMDVVSLAQFGIRYAVATLGTATTHEHLTRLFRICPEVVCCFDGDRAGRDAAWRALTTALPVMREGLEMRFMFLPDGEDPDTLVRQLGSDGFEAQIARAVPFSQFFFDALSRDLDLSSLDGRARLVEQARPLLAQLPAGVYRQMMVARLAETVRMERAELAGTLGLGGGEAASRPRAVRPAPGRSGPSPVRTAISLLLQRPALAAEAGDPRRFASLDLPGIPLLIELVELLQANPHITTGAVLERWRGTDDGRHLDKLATRTSLVEEDSLASEFSGALTRLQERATESRTEDLLAKAAQNSLSDAEKQELKQLLNRNGQAG